MATRLDTIAPRLLAYPMHGQHKLLSEGYRTRDGHLIEWLGSLTSNDGGVAVISRPEPALLPVRTPAGRGVAHGTHPVSTRTLRLPNPRSRRRWWVDSASGYPVIPASLADLPALVWNPFTALSGGARSPFSGRVTVFDLLDDWTKHYAFHSIRDDVDRAYRAAFAAATHVTANAEGTAELARRYGRDDVLLLPNGCDPHRFEPHSTAAGRTRVGYVGKIGNRLDLDGILVTAAALPDVEFVFAGPILDRAYRAPLEAAPNITLLGDVHYEDVPALLRSFDVGWVPHNVGDLEVGGDIIKTYEYRAAALPTLSTPVVGAGSRGLDGITALPIGEHAGVLRGWITDGGRVPRRPGIVPEDATWEHKARSVSRLLMGAEVTA